MVENNVANEMAKTNYKLLCDVETLCAWLVCCPYWNQCMDFQNSLQGMGLLFITLLVLCSLLKHMSFQCIMTSKSTSFLYISPSSWTFWSHKWCVMFGLVNQTYFASATCYLLFWKQTLHVTYDISKDGGVGHNKKGNLGSCHYFYETTIMLHSCYKFDKWTKQVLPNTRSVLDATKFIHSTS